MTAEQITSPKPPLFGVPVAIVVAGALIAAALYFSGSKVTAPGTSNQGGGIGQQPAVAAQSTAPQPNVDITKVKIVDEPFFGNPNAAVTIAYWYDYQCPFCKQNEQNAMPQLIKDYVDTGKVKIVFKDFQFLGADSQTLGKYSRAVWAVAPDKFYQWHKVIYDNQGTENTGWATQDKILSLTKTILGVNSTNKVTQLVIAKGADYQKVMDADKAEGSTFGVSGTPSFVIGKQLVSGAQPYPTIKAAIDGVLK